MDEAEMHFKKSIDNLAIRHKEKGDGESFENYDLYQSQENSPQEIPEENETNAKFYNQSEGSPLRPKKQFTMVKELDEIVDELLGEISSTANYRHCQTWDTSVESLDIEDKSWQ